MTERVKDCIICRHDATNPQSDQGHDVDEHGYCVACRRRSKRMKAEIKGRLAGKVQP